MQFDDLTIDPKHEAIAVDLDGTLATYDHWTGSTVIGEPIPEMVRRVKQWLAAGVPVWIFTARLWEESTHGRGGPITDAISKWSQKQFNKVLPSTAIKYPFFARIYDDRARQVEMNTGRLIGQRV